MMVVNDNVVIGFNQCFTVVSLCQCVRSSVTFHDVKESLVLSIDWNLIASWLIAAVALF